VEHHAIVSVEILAIAQAVVNQRILKILVAYVLAADVIAKIKLAVKQKLVVKLKKEK